LIAKVKEKKMANKRFLLGILVMALVFGMTVVGCKDSIDDNKLDGDWVNGSSIMKYHNGNYESLPSGVQTNKGTYTINSGLITHETTHIHGNYYLNQKSLEQYSGLERIWYTKDQLKTAMRRSVKEYYKDKFGETYNIPEETFTTYDKSIESMYSQSTLAYTFVNKNTVIIGSQTWVKK
jgi:hypothetical protein